MDRTQLDTAIRSANINGTRDELLAQLRELPDNTLFDSPFALASDKQTNAPALDAARILLELNPQCPIPCVDVIRNIVHSDWFISLEELPWYVVQQFGRETVHQSIKQVRSESLTADESSVLRTIAYWTGLAPTES